MNDIAVAVLTKPPLPGRVKTRLAGALTNHGCARLARWQLDRTLRVAAAGAVGPVTLWVAGGPWHPYLRERARAHGVGLATQRGSDLGERMAHAVRASMDGHAGVLLLGTDCPGLAPEDLRTAAGRLADGVDVVLGPARDGGYYLAALRRFPPAIFRPMDWGGGSVLQTTLRRLARAGYSVSLLEPKTDLDRPADLEGSAFRAGLGRLFQG